MKQKKIVELVILFFLLPLAVSLAQPRVYNPKQMLLNVGNISMTMNKANGVNITGSGGLQSQWSWNLTGANRQYSEIFYWPQDQWQSNMLYQIFNPLVLDDKGIIDEKGAVHPVFSRGASLTNISTTDWAREVRRYRPPHITVDGIAVDPPYKWFVDPALKTDIKIEFEDVCEQFGIRSHVEMYGFANPNHADYFIWKATHKFTGEVKIPRETVSVLDTLPDQTIRFWWPLSFSFGPSKAGEMAVTSGYSFEGEDDLDSWVKIKSNYSPNGIRDSLYIAYYYDYRTSGSVSYSNGSTDDMGDPDRITGVLNSPQIPGFTLLYADKSASEKIDNAAQPYSMPTWDIVNDFWGDKTVGIKAKYRGDDGRGHFPLDIISSGFASRPTKGPMRFITVGPYELTKNKAANRYDSLTFVYAVGAGSIGHSMADSVGRMWLKKTITDAEKDAWVLKGKDSLAKTLDRAKWAWDRLSKGGTVPAPPPPPDVNVKSGPDKIVVSWSYPESSYFLDPVTGADDWAAWRVYRKRGAKMVNDPRDQKSGAVWDLVFETTNRSQTSFEDMNVDRGVDYYYAVTALDNGTQNPDDIVPNMRLESNRNVTNSLVAATAFKPGLNQSDLIRVVPNPATNQAGTAFAGGNIDRINFFNLPFKCKLRIFTETGDLVKSVDHLGTADGTADDKWNQRTDDNQIVASGIYILVVTDCYDNAGKSLDNQFVKFIIVR